MKRRISIAHAAAVVAAGALALAGCAGGGGSLPTGTGGDEPVTLVIPTSQAPWNPAYEQLVQEYEEATGNTVDLRPFPNPDVKTQQINDIQSQQHVFDVYQINEADIAQFNASQWIEPFTNIDSDYEAAPEIYSYSNIARFDQETQVFSPEGEVTSAPLLGNVDVFVYRKDIYEQLRLDVPETWEEMIENGEAIQESGLVPYGGVYRTQATPGAYGIAYEFQALMNGAGASWFRDPGADWTPAADSPEAAQAGDWFRQLAETGPEATTTIGQAQVIATMQSGDAGQTYAVAAAASQLEDEANSSVGGKMGYAPLPPAADGSSSTATGVWVLAIPAGLDEARSKAALEYITWMTSAEAMQRFAELGGIPVRSDAFDVDGLTPAAQETLDAVKATVANLPEVPTSLRYPFASEMLGFMEGPLQDVAAGAVSPEDGMATLQRNLEGLVEEQDLPIP